MASKKHASFCFDILHAHHGLKDQSDILAEFEDESYPLFVTWYKNNNGQEELRGCIGNFAPSPLRSGLRDYALVSALEDPRFPPISKQELSFLTCGISLLTNFEDASSFKDWEVGKHGIIIDFTVLERKYRATYLPEVASEQGWNHEETITSLIRKSGFRGKINSEIMESIKITRYSSSKVKMTFKEYMQGK